MTDSTNDLPLDDYSAFAPTLVEAIEACRDDDPYSDIELPEGLTYRDSNVAPAHELVSHFRLDAFVN